MILYTAFIYTIELLDESKELLKVFIDMLLNSPQETRLWVMYSDEKSEDSSVRKDESLLTEKSFKSRNQIA